jgi:hypothetical protein
MMFEVFERTLPRRCHALPFASMERVSLLYPGTPDAIGELPILTAEADNQQVVVGHPGIDTFLGERAGLLEKGWRNRLRARFAAHQQRTLAGQQALELGEEGYEIDEPAPDPGQPESLTKVDAVHYGLIGDGPVPDGYVVIGDAQNPFTKERTRLLVKA